MKKQIGLKNERLYCEISVILEDQKIKVIPKIYKSEVQKNQVFIYIEDKRNKK